MELKTIKEFAHKNNLGDGLEYSNDKFRVNLNNSLEITYINNQLSIINQTLNKVYKVKGSTTVANINSMTVGNAMVGYVYNMLDSGIITNGIEGEFDVVKGDNIVYTEEGWDEFSVSLDLALRAGKNISIENDAINALGYTYNKEKKSFSVGEGNATGHNSYAEGQGTTATGLTSHAEGTLTKAYGNYSHAEGHNTESIGDFSHAEGRDTIASGSYSHIEGRGVYTQLDKGNWELGSQFINFDSSQQHSIGSVLKIENSEERIFVKIINISEDGLTITVDKQISLEPSNSNLYVVNGVAYGDYSHVEGYNTTASSEHSHAEGEITKACGRASHSEGLWTIAQGKMSHAEGSFTTASGESSHAEGYMSVAQGDSSHAEGNRTKALGTNSHAEGFDSQAIGEVAHAEGYQTQAIGKHSHAEGYKTQALGLYSHSEGYYTKASGLYSHAEGYGTEASDYHSHAEGQYTIAVGSESHAEGGGGSKQLTEYNWESNSKSITFDSVQSSIKIGSILKISNSDERIFVKVIGISNNGLTITVDKQISLECIGCDLSVVSGVAYSTYSHSEGLDTTASGLHSHAEGSVTIASSLSSHAEGSNTIASGEYSHAEGLYTTASNYFSHAEGVYTIANNRAEHAQGKYNVSNTGETENTQTIHSIGIGKSVDNRKNAQEIMQNGDYYIVGIGGYNGANINEEGVKTLQEVLNEILEKIS